MQWKVSSSLFAIASLFLLSAGDLVVAQITSPGCTGIGSWQWSYNSLNQNPCTVAAYLLSTCYGGVFDLAPLGFYTGYSGPSSQEVLEAGGCWCNTVAYSLASACSECQGGSAISWSVYVESCKTVLGPSTFPNPVPAGTSVPQWAVVAISGDKYWDPSTAKIVGDSPEITPGELINTPAAVPAPPPTPTPTVVPVPTLFPSHTVVPETTATLSTSALPFSGSGNRSDNGGSKQGAIVWGVTTMAVISGLFLTLIPRLV